MVILFVSVPMVFKDHFLNSDNQCFSFVIYSPYALCGVILPKNECVLLPCKYANAKDTAGRIRAHFSAGLDSAAWVCVGHLMLRRNGLTQTVPSSLS